jgi:hypothetical protein
VRDESAQKQLFWTFLFLFLFAPKNEQNYCAQLGGTLSVLRQRPGDKEMVDVTEYLQNSKLTGAYNGVDSSFVDNYLMDC